MSPTFERASRIEPKIKISFENLRQLQDIESALEMIKSGQNGARILSEIARVSTGEKNLLIMDAGNGASETGGELTPVQESRYGLNLNTSPHQQYMKKLLEVSSNGEGAKSIIFYNPNISVGIDNDDHSWVVKTRKEAFVSLAHELIHAFHVMNGTSKAAGLNAIMNKNSPQKEEEDRATGIGRYAGSTFSENGVRADHDLPLRASYFTKNGLENPCEYPR